MNAYLDYNFRKLLSAAAVIIPYLRQLYYLEKTFVLSVVHPLLTILCLGLGQLVNATLDRISSVRSFRPQTIMPSCPLIGAWRMGLMSVRYIPTVVIIDTPHVQYRLQGAKMWLGCRSITAAIITILLASYKFNVLHI